MIPNRTANRILLLLAGILAAASGILILAVDTVTVTAKSYGSWKVYETYTWNRSLSEIMPSDFPALTLGVFMLFCFALACIITAFKRFHGRKMRWFWLAFLIAALTLLLIGFLSVQKYQYMQTSDNLPPGYYNVSSHEVQFFGWLLFAAAVNAGILYCIHLLVGQSNRKAGKYKLQPSPQGWTPAVQVPYNRPVGTPDKRYERPVQPPSGSPYAPPFPGTSGGSWQCGNCRNINSGQQETCLRCGLRRSVVSSPAHPIRKN